jgi:hypothetical protein
LLLFFPSVQRRKFLPFLHWCSAVWKLFFKSYFFI